MRGKWKRPMVPRSNLKFAIERRVAGIESCEPCCLPTRIRGLNEVLQAARQTGLSQARDLSEDEVRDLERVICANPAVVRKLVGGMLLKVGLEEEFIP